MTTPKLKEWADCVKRRDGKCLDCGSSNDLHAHHIKPKSTHPELTLDVENGKTLCYRCHKAEHERNRPVRVRSNRPNRRTLERKLAELTQRLADVESRLATTTQELKWHRCKCEIGECKPKLKRAA